MFALQYQFWVVYFVITRSASKAFLTAQMNTFSCKLTRKTIPTLRASPSSSLIALPQEYNVSSYDAHLALPQLEHATTSISTLPPCAPKTIGAVKHINLSRIQAMFKVATDTDLRALAHSLLEYTIFFHAVALTGTQ